MHLRVLILAALFMPLVAPVSQAQEIGSDTEGCNDSALLHRMPGCIIAECTNKEFDAAELQTGAASAEKEAPTKALEGRVERLMYRCPVALSQLQIARNVQNALKSAGYVTVFSGKGSDDLPMVTARKGTQWIQVKTSQWNEFPAYEQTAVAESAMVQKLEATADSFAEEIAKSGHVAVYGISFDSGKSVIKPESAAVLGEIATLLQRNPDWKMRVEGHTDNTGKPATNASLSAERAKAVVAWLRTNGTDAARLTAKGLGDTKPVAGNDTEEGRAKNRRVELVKI